MNFSAFLVQKVLKIFWFSLWKSGSDFSEVTRKLAIKKGSVRGSSSGLKKSGNSLF